MSNIRIVFAALLLAGSGAAGATTIDFEGLSQEGGPEGFELAGYQFDFAPAANPLPPSYVLTGGILAWCPGCSMSLARADGSVFDLNGFDIRFFPDPYEFTLTGYLEGGGTVMQTVAATAVNPVTFNSDWDQVLRVDFVTTPDTPSIIDNLRVNVVPVPAAAWLFASALVGLGWLRRRRTLA